MYSYFYIIKKIGLKKIFMKNYYKNIHIDYIFTIFKSLDVTHGIWMLYLASKGLSLFQIGVLEGIFHITSMIMETPTGAIADIFGRKSSRLIGIIFSVLACGIMILSNSYILFIVSFILSALSYNFESGAGEALVYDSLIACKKEKSFMKIIGRKEVFYQAASVIALIIGGYVGNIQYHFAYFLALGFSLVAFIVGLFFSEPQVRENKIHMSVPQAIKAQYINSFIAIKSSSRLAYLILLTSFTCASITLSFYYLQIAWLEANISIFAIGIYLAIAALCAAVGALLADKIEKRLGESFLLKTVPLIMAIFVGLLAFNKFSIYSFCILSCMEAILYVTSRDYINKIIKSESRATILSFDSMAFSVSMIIMFPVFGLISDNLGIHNSFIILGGIMLIGTIINLFIKEGSKKENPDNSRGTVQ